MAPHLVDIPHLVNTFLSHQLERTDSIRNPSIPHLVAVPHSVDIPHLADTLLSSPKIHQMRWEQYKISGYLRKKFFILNGAQKSDKP